MFQRSKLIPFMALVAIALLLTPVSLTGLQVSHFTVQEYQLRTLYSYPWDNTESVSAWNAFGGNESFYIACLKAIALSRSGYPRNSPEFRGLVEWIKSQQREDGSFPAVITDDYPKPDLDWFYWEPSKAAGTGLGILALLEGGESPNSKEIRQAVAFLLKNESGNHWMSTVYLYWEKTGLHEVNESPSIVATAYAVAALSRLGYNTTKEWDWLRGKLTPERLVKPYLHNFFTGFLFPMPYRDMRAPYESIVLPLLFLREKKMTPPEEMLDFMASMFEKTQYSGNATLRLSFEGTVNYTVEEIAYWTNGWKVIESWKGTGRNVRVKIKPENSKGEIKFLIRSTRPLLSNESGIFKGDMRLYPELPENYISFIGEGYPRKSVFQFDDGKSYAVIESPYFDASWNHDVYSTAIALIWLYLAGKDEKIIGEALKFLELASPRDDMSFDGDAYALIALSLYSGKWKNTPGPTEEKPGSQHGLSWELPVIFAVGLLIGTLIGVKVGKKGKV